MEYYKFSGTILESHVENVRTFVTLFPAEFPVGFCFEALETTIFLTINGILLHYLIIFFYLFVTARQNLSLS